MGGCGKNVLKHGNIAEEIDRPGAVSIKSLSASTLALAAVRLKSPTVSIPREQ